MADVTLQARINGGSVRTGGIRTGVAVGDTCQLTALSKAGWDGTRVVWEIYDYPPDFACPSGWSEDSDGVYYVAGSADPPVFELTHWGKYLTRVTAANQSPDERTCIDIVSPAGLRDIMRREGAQFGGNRALWVKDQKNNLRVFQEFITNLALGPTMRSLPSCTFHLAPWNPARINLVSGLVDSATDQAGGGNVMSASNSTARLTYNTSGVDTLNGKPSVSCTTFYAAFEQFRSLSGASSGPAAYSMACVAKYRSFDAVNFTTLMTNGDWPGVVVAFAAWIGALPNGTDQDGGGYLRGLTTTTDADLLPHTFLATHDGTTGRFYIDGFLVAEAASTPDTRTGKIGIYTTAAGSRVADAARFDAQWCSSNIGPSGVKQYVQDAAEFFGLWKPGVLYLNGDSITACNTLSDAATNGWPVRILPLLNSNSVQVVNAGVGGRTIDTIANVIGVATSTNAQYSDQRRFGPGKIGNVEIIWAGTNDNYGITVNNPPAPIAASIWANIQARANASIARGFIPIIGTMLRRAGGTANEEIVRTTVNTSINNSSYYKFDLAEHPAFLSTASVAQTVVGFSDGIHPTDQANIDVIAPAIAAVCNVALNAEAA